MAFPARPYRFVAALLAGLLFGLHGAPLLHHWCMSMEQGAAGMEHMAMAMDAEPHAMLPCHDEEAPDAMPQQDAIMVCCTTALVGLHATPAPRPHADAQVVAVLPVLVASPETSAPSTSLLPPLDTGPPPAVPLHILYASFLS